MKRVPYLFAAGTPMAELHRAFPWASTPLGPPETWDTSLKTLVPIMLASSQPMFVVWGGARTLLYNDPYAEILADKHPDALGRDFLEVWHEIRADLTPIVEAVYRGEPVRMDDILLWMERRGYREETHFAFSYSPVRDESGEVGGFFCACNEITSQILAERRLAESEARHRGVLQNMEEGFVLFDRDFNILEINAATEQLTGFPRAELIGFSHWERFPGSYEAPVGQMYRQVLAERTPRMLEHAWRFPDGREYWFELRAFPVGEGLAVLFRDVRSRRQMIDALREADRRKDEFLAMLAHELRNPLAPITAASHLLGLAGGDPQRVREASEVITRQVGHLTRLVDDLLDVSRVTRGLVHLEHTPVDLRMAVSTAIEQAGPLLEARRHALRTDLSETPVVVSGDFHRLVQIISNLLNNAAKYTPRGGRIALTLGTGQGRAVLEVTDNGVGIAPEMLGRVFDLFSQAERAADRSQGGLGIGLALVRSLVQLHGGEVHALSRGLQQGSTFRVELPLSTAIHRSEPVPPAALPAAKRRVLLVDDNVDAAATLADVLRLTDHTVDVAHDGTSALAAAAGQTAWDACILDIGLPDMTGYELATRLRALPSAREATFVALTGYGQGHDLQASRTSGFDHHLVKPADLHRLIALIAGKPA